MPQLILTGPADPLRPLMSAICESIYREGDCCKSYLPKAAVISSVSQYSVTSLTLPSASRYTMQ